MRVLWVIASPIGNTAKVLFGKEEIYDSGHWIDNTVSSIIASSKDIELAIVTTSNVEKILKIKNENVIYYCLNSGKAHVGKKFDRVNIDKAKYVIDDFQPDVISVWGSETGIGLLFAEAAGSIPVALFLQGIMSAIAKYPNGGLRWKQLTGHNVLDMMKYPFLNRLNNIYYRQALIERKFLESIDHVISESEWAFSFCKEINAEINTYWFPLQIGEVYKNNNWDLKNIDRLRIFTVAGRGAHKGIHNVLRAMSILVKKYPSALVYIPGKNPFGGKNIMSKISQTPYTSYLKRLIKENSLEKNIIFTGMLNSDEMVEQLCKCNVFVMPSSIENQSTSLREALSIGSPTVASYVGCVNESIIHEKNGLLYRYEEYEVLAHYISLIFDDDKLAVKFSNNAREHMKLKYFTEDSGEILHSIYHKIIENNPSIERED